MTQNSSVFSSVKPWHTSINDHANKVSSTNWFIATCFLIAIQYSIFNGESVGTWSLVLMAFYFSVRLSYFGDFKKSLIINHEY